MFVRLLLIASVILFAPFGVSAHSPRFVDVGQHDIVTITDPDVSQAFYGELTSFPHLFEIKSETQLDLNVAILVPDMWGAQNNISGIIIRQVGNGSVEEVTRMPASSALWKSEYEFFGGDSYRHGPTFSETLPAGTYQIEVSTPENKGKYVLVVGTKEVFSLWDYFGTVRDIAKIKIFFGKTIVGTVQSPLVSVPLLLISLVGFFIYRRYKKNS